MNGYKYDKHNCYAIKFLCKEKDFLFMLNLQDKIMRWEHRYSCYTPPPILTEKIKSQ